MQEGQIGRLLREAHKVIKNVPYGDPQCYLGFFYWWISIQSANCQVSCHLMCVLCEFAGYTLQGIINCTLVQSLAI